MLKEVKAFFLTLIVGIVALTLNVNAASTATVNSQADLKEALDDESITTIILGSDIDTTEKINIVRPVTIDGQNHTIRYVGTFGDEGSRDNTVWSGIYVLQFYKTTGTLKDIKLTGGNAGLLLNGSEVTFEGTIDVSGNGFGGIELGQGANVTETPHLKLEGDAEIVNTTEAEDAPTLWVPDDTKTAILESNGMQETISAGEELTIIEALSYFNVPTENPQTADFNKLSIVLGFMSLFIFALTMSKIMLRK